MPQVYSLEKVAMNLVPVSSLHLPLSVSQSRSDGLCLCVSVHLSPYPSWLLSIPLVLFIKIYISLRTASFSSPQIFIHSETKKEQEKNCFTKEK